MPEPNFFLHGQPRFYDFVALADTNTTSLAKSGRGFFHSLTLTGGTAGTVIVYDNTDASGTIIASFGAEEVSFSGDGDTVKAESYLFDIAFQTGLVVATTAVDSPRLTLTYR